MTYNQFRNLLAFVALVGSSTEGRSWMGVSPDYMTEKFNRYVGVGYPKDVIGNDDAWQTGLHPALKMLTDKYCEIWGILDPENES